MVMRNHVAISIIILCSHSLFAQFASDNFDWSTVNWSSTTNGNSANLLEVANTNYSIDNNSLQVVHYDVNNQSGNYSQGYTFGNSEESAIKYRYFQSLDQFNVVLKFDWRCNGESERDFGTLYYSTDAMNWEKLKTYQSGNGAQTQNESLLLPKCLENTGFYIGFSFIADNSFNFQPGIVIDNIELWGNYCPSFNKPPTPINQGTIVKCYNNRDAVPLSATTSTGNLRWYANANGCAEYLHEGLNYYTLPTENKTFYVTSFNGNNGCESTNRLAVNLITLPLPVIYVDTIINATLGGDGAVSISVSGSGPFFYFWSLNNDSTFMENTQDLSGIEEGNYQLFVYDNNNCKDSVRVVVLSKAELNIPEGLSPNGDGYNDDWKISGIEQWTDYVVELRNIRGELVYKQDATDNPSYVPFDGLNQKGEKLPPGDYTYILRSKFRKKKYSGILSIKYD